MGQNKLSKGSKAGVVLVYHGVTCSPPLSTRTGKYFVAKSSFVSQLEWLRQSGRLVPLDRFWSGATAAQPGGIVLTFDDGNCSDFEHVYPLLVESGIAACFFLNSSNVGQAGFITWSQAREMSRSGMLIQSHSHRHAFLTRLSPASLHNEVKRSKELIEHRIGAAVRYLAAPYGDLNRRVLDAALAAGYAAVLSGRSRPAVPGEVIVPRVCVYGNTDLNEFRRLAERDRWIYAARAVRDLALCPPKYFALRMSHLSAAVLEVAKG